MGADREPGRREQWKPKDGAGANTCVYAHPAVSTQPAPNSDLAVDRGSARWRSPRRPLLDDVELALGNLVADVGAAERTWRRTH